MVVWLAATKFKPLVLSVPGFALSNIANIYIFVVLYDFCLLRLTSELYSPGTDHKENTRCFIGYCYLGTDPVENAAFPLLRSGLGSDHIENMSRGVCLATVVNTYHQLSTACTLQY
jgi:hypothetical protein